MKALIERLEAATEGSEDDDRLVCRELGIVWSSDEDGQFGGYGIMPRRVWVTRSMEAAMRGLPDDWVLAQLWSSASIKDWPWWGCTLRRYSGHDIVSQRSVEGAKSPALAITIANLKARS